MCKQIKKENNIIFKKHYFFINISKYKMLSDQCKLLTWYFIDMKSYQSRHDILRYTILNILELYKFMIADQKFVLSTNFQYVFVSFFVPDVHYCRSFVQNHFQQLSRLDGRRNVERKRALHDFVFASFLIVIVFVIEFRRHVNVFVFFENFVVDVTVFRQSTRKLIVEAFQPRFFRSLLRHFVA